MLLTENDEVFLKVVLLNEFDSIFLRNGSLAVRRVKSEGDKEGDEEFHGLGFKRLNRFVQLFQSIDE